MRCMTIPWLGYKSCSASPLGILAHKHLKLKCRVCPRWKLAYSGVWVPDLLFSISGTISAPCQASYRGLELVYHIQLQKFPM